MFKYFQRFFIQALLLLVVTPCAFGQEYNQREVESKILSTIGYIRRYYVEKADLSAITDKSIVEMLNELDPHSVFIPAKEVEKANEPLQGNFDGIGVSFQIMKDTINVVEVIAGGPSEKLGVLAGDKIVKIDDKIAYGDTITNSFVFNNLRGKKGTMVELWIKRNGKKDLIHFKIARDKIPIYSVDSYFMIDKSVGYIRLDRFARTTMDEFRKAFSELKDQGMKDLVFDLRGNGGGFLDIAISLTDEFLDKDKMIVYTEGVASPKQVVMSSNRGEFRNGKLVVLIDEGSASASEIFSGAVQDWDRGVLVGRRSFGKGLVQRIFPLPDNSEIRLTTSRYYTPSGRSIQKPYKDGAESYYSDLMKRYTHKELITADSIQFPDSLKFFTNGKRVVYGGGGIMPDVFVSIDTLRASDYLIELRSKGILNSFTLNWSNEHRTHLLNEYPLFEDFNKHYDTKNMYADFKSYVEKEGVNEKDVKKDWVASWFQQVLSEKVKDSVSYQDYEKYAKTLFADTSVYSEVMKKAKSEDEKLDILSAKSDEYISYLVKAMVARNLYGSKYYYTIMAETDEGFKKAVEIIKDDALYHSILSTPKKRVSN